MSENQHTIFIDVKSAKALRPLSELIDDAFANKDIIVCQYHIGSHMPMWREARKGDQAIFAIDDIGCAGGEITILNKKVFRPRWVPDNNQYRNLIHFAHGLNPRQFDREWVDHMLEQHCLAIDNNRWLFVTLAVIVPAYRLDHNRELLLEKARQMEAAEEELERDAARWAMGEYMESEGYSG